MVDAINSRHLPSLCSNVEQLLQSYVTNTLRYSHIRIYLDNIDRVYTSSFSLSDLSAPAHGDVRIDRIKGVRLSAEKVEYQVDVRRFVEIRTSLPVKALNVPRNRSLAIFPSTAAVTFKCAFPVTVQPDADTWLYVDYADFQNSTGGRCIPELNRIPQGIYGYDVSPEVFECVESVK